jgi:CoA:oxalate CoA-transferase
MSRLESGGQALSDLVVVDLTQLVSGAVATMLLSDFGARVIKIEPLHGELYRSAGRAVAGPTGETTSLNIVRFSRGKESVAIDLKTEAGQGLLRRLVGQADVLVENFRPGVLARLGLSLEEMRGLNPNLVYTSVSGFGHDDLFPSPYADRPAYALVVEAMAGLTHLAGADGGPPVWMGFAMADIFAGTLAFGGILAALHNRGESDEGARVDIAMYDGAVFMNELAFLTYSASEEVLGRGQYAFQAPWGPFATLDGYVAIAVLSEPQWKALCNVMGNEQLANDPRLQNGSERAKHHDELVGPAVSRWTSERRTAECVDLLLARSVPAAPVNDAADLLDCPQLDAREMLVDVVDPVLGTVKVVGNPIKIAPRGPRPRTAIPRLGEHTESVLRDIAGVSHDELTALRESGVIGQADPVKDVQQ